MTACRGCGKAEVTRVVDLGKVPAADHFPLAADPVRAEEASHALAMDVCCVCGLAQLADDDTVADEPRGVEPQALKDQAEDAIGQVAAVGLATWEYRPRIRKPAWWYMDPAARRTWVHDGDVAGGCGAGLFRYHARTRPAEAFERRARVTAPDGVLLLQYHSIATIVEQGQWNALRHGHFAYYSLTALMYLLSTVGMRVATAWEFDLYGGTVLVAAVHGAAVPDETFKRILATEEALGVTNPDCICRLQHYADRHVDSLRNWLEEEAEAGRTVLGYGAASRAVALFSRAGLNSDLLAAVADASVAKQGRRMPGTDIPIISPDELLAARPDRVLLTLPDLLPELRARMPELDGRWKVDGQFTE